jgi:Uma2 family endonuclease
MGEAAQPRPLSLEAYLEWEAQSPERHELVEGVPYAMAGASKAHNLLVQNLAFLLRAPARAKGCRLYTETVKLKVSQSTLYYPDLMVVCGSFSPHPLYEEAPCLVAEVVSPGTERLDRGEKRLAYLGLPSLKAYLLVSASEPRVEVYRKSGKGVAHEVYTEGQALLPCVDAPLDLHALYEDVELERA